MDAAEWKYLFFVTSLRQQKSCKKKETAILYNTGGWQARKEENRQQGWPARGRRNAGSVLKIE